MQILLTGNVNIDILMGRLLDWPQQGTETILEHYELRPGGTLGNMALALHALDANVRYYANVGSDMFGQWLRAELEQCACELVTTTTPTAVTVGVSHPDGQRTFFSTLGHLAHFDIEPLEHAIEQAQPGDLLFIGGYFLVPSLREHARVLLQQAHQRKLTTCIDTGWPSEGWTREVKREIQELLRYCTYFLPNELELQAFTDTADNTTALMRVSGMGGGVTIVKLGPDGAGYLEQGSLRVFPAPHVTVVDTVGAGDCFNAGLIAGLQRGLVLGEAIELAVQLASQAVSSTPRTYLSWESIRRR